MAKQVDIFKFFGSVSSKRNINVVRPKEHGRDEQIVRTVINDMINQIVKDESKDKKSTTDFSFCFEKATK